MSRVMKGMSVADRYEDISKRSGLSINIVKKVLECTRDSIELSLEKGERATIPSIVTMVPEIGVRYSMDNSFNKKRTFVKAKPSLAGALSDKLAEHSQFLETAEEEDPLAPIRGMLLTDKIDGLL